MLCRTDDVIESNMTRKTATHKWQFQSRFRRGTFGWRSQPAIQRVKEAVSEIKKVRRKDPMLAAEGAVRFLERVSAALETGSRFYPEGQASEPRLSKIFVSR